MTEAVLTEIKHVVRIIGALGTLWPTRPFDAEGLVRIAEERLSSLWRSAQSHFSAGKEYAAEQFWAEVQRRFPDGDISHIEVELEPAKTKKRRTVWVTVVPVHGCGKLELELH